MGRGRVERGGMLAACPGPDYAHPIRYPDNFTFITSLGAIDAHGKTPHMKALGGKLKDKTDKGGAFVFYELLK